VQDESHYRLQTPHHCLGIFQLDRQVCPLPADHLHYFACSPPGRQQKILLASRQTTKNARQTTRNSHLSYNSRTQCNAAAKYLHVHKPRFQAVHLIAGESNACTIDIATMAYVTALRISCEKTTDDRNQKGHTPLGQQQLCCMAL